MPYSSVVITLDTYAHLLPGMQEAAARGFDEGLSRYKTVPEATTKPLAYGLGINALVGGANTPFPGVILTELSEEEALFYRDVHVALRRAAVQDERVQLLATRLALTDGQWNQVVALISKLNGTR